jgi:hypothetical protein
MKIIFPLFLGMLAMIGLGVWMHTTILANLIGVASFTGLLILYFRQPVNQEIAIGEEIDHLSAEQKKQWYSLFIIGLIFSFIFGTFWNSQMGGM